MVERWAAAIAMAAAVGVLMAGCLGTSEPDSAGPSTSLDPEWALRALEPGHDHKNSADHAGFTTPNFQILGWSPLITEAYGTSLSSVCGDVGERDGRRLAVGQGDWEDNDVAFTLSDVTDAANPRYLGEMVIRTTGVYDVAIVPDGRHVALVTVGARTPDQMPAAISSLPGPAGAEPGGEGVWWRSPCTSPGWHRVLGQAPREEYVPHPASILLINIDNPASPTIVDEKPLGGYGHSVNSAEVAGRALLVAAMADQGMSFNFYEVVPGPLGAQLQLLSVYVPLLSLDRGVDQVFGNSHDAWIAVHPVLQRPLAWLAAWDGGLLILDLQDVSNPQLLGRWNDFDPAQGGDTGNLHAVFAMPKLWSDGRHYTIVGPEWGGHPMYSPSGIVHVLDTTDPTRPFQVAAWTLPHDVVWDAIFSPHYFSVVDHTLFVSMYHGGIWAVDLSGIGTQAFVNLPSVGVFVPINITPFPREGAGATPTLYEALALADGTLVTFDRNSGLYTFRFDEARPMPPPPPWPIEPVLGVGGTAGPIWSHQVNTNADPQG